MMPFRKLSAASKGKLLLAYFTESRPEPTRNPGLTTGKVLEPGGRLTNYYTGRDTRATWRPDMPISVAKALGVDPTRMPKDSDLTRLFEAKRGDNGEAWSKQKREISAYDFVFSPHKSVTLAAEFAQTPAEAAAIRNAVYRANDAAMRYIARELGWARKGKGGEGGADPGAVGWVSFYHYTARPTVPVQDGPGGATYLADAPTVGDPFDHVHNVLFNVVVTDEGRVGSLDTQRLHERVHEFGGYAQARLANELRALGIRIGYNKDERAVVIEAIPELAVGTFSKSRQHVLRSAKAFAQRQGLDWDAISAEAKFEILHEAAVADRIAKHGDKSDRELWRTEAEEIGWAHTTVLDEVSHRPLTDSERYELVYAFAARHLGQEFRTAAVIDIERMRTHVANGFIGAGIKDPDDIDRVVELLESRGIDLNGERVALIVAAVDEKVSVTNTAQVRIEATLAAQGQRAALDRSGALSPQQLKHAIGASGLDFTDEHGSSQLAAIHALGQGGALTMLTGVAGSGKTTLLKPLVAAWTDDARFDPGGREVVGVSTAWRQTDPLQDAGIDKRFALQPLMDAIASGEFAPTRNTVLVIDEVSQVGPRTMLALIELQNRTGMTIKALGDREQCQAIEAGDTIEILRRSLPKSEMPELLTSIRQETRRGREIAGLFRGVELGKYAALEDRQKHRIAEVTQALAMKREDGTAMLVGGDHDQVAGHIADLYLQRRDILRASGSGRAVTISAPTNEDAAEISRAIRDRMKLRGELGPELLYPAIDQRSTTFDLPIAAGDKVRLFRRTRAMIDGRKGWIGNNGNVVEVVAVTPAGLTVRDEKGRIGDVEWRRLADPETGRLKLGFGHALTIDAAQGITSGEHINALPRGSSGLTAFKAYVAESRSQGATWTLASEAALHEAVKRGMALGDATPVTVERLWQRMAEDMAEKPYKRLATDLMENARADRVKATDAFLRQGHAIQAAGAQGRNPGQEMRTRARDIHADKLLSGQAAGFEQALRQAGGAARGIGQDMAAHQQGAEIRAFLAGQADGSRQAGRPDSEVRRAAQAEAVRNTLARHVAGLDAAMRSNQENLRGLGAEINAHLRSMRVEAEAARRNLTTDVRARSRSPSPG